MPDGTTLLEIGLDAYGTDTIKRLSKVFGVRRNLRIERKGLELVNIALKAGLAAYKSKVPIDTGELRDNMILAEMTSTSPFNPVGQIYISNTSHGRNNIPGDQLANILDRLKLKRTQPGKRAEGEFSASPSQYTEGWMDEAKNDLSQWIERNMK